MTLKKALKGIDQYLEDKRELTEGLKNEVAKWSDDKLTSLCRTLINALQIDIEFLIRLREQLEPKQESIKKKLCRHPKNMRDKSGSVWYCMNCNQDL